jgi:large subunit ribosomal protein L15
MNLNDVHRGIQGHKKRRRVGRGTGSGRGKTSSRGHKGQKARAGFSQQPIFQGGAMPLVRRVPKRGFNNKFALTVATVNVGQLEAAFQAGDEVTPESLKAKSLIGARWDVVKILGDGTLNKSLNISAHRFSQQARDKIEQAGGQLTELPGKTPVAEKQQATRTEAAGTSQ